MEVRDSPGLTPSEGRRFAFPVGAAFLLLAGIAWWRGYDNVLLVTGSVGGLLVLAGILLPGKLGPVYRAWMGFAAVLGRITNPIVMGAMYYLVLTPTGLLRRAMGKNALVRSPQNDSYWVERAEGSRRSDLERQF